MAMVLTVEEIEERIAELEADRVTAAFMEDWAEVERIEEEIAALQRLKARLR